MGQPQTHPHYSPSPLEKQGLSTRAIITIVLSAVAVVAIVGALLAGSFLSRILQSSSLSTPKVAVTNPQGSITDDCGVYSISTTTWTFTATLVNTGASGIANIGYNVNGQQVASNTYSVPAGSQLPISESVTLHQCYGSTTPPYSIVLLSERSA